MARALFERPDSCTAYLGRLSELRQELGLEVYGYCLMGTHAHLIVNPGEEATTRLSTLVKGLLALTVPEAATVESLLDQSAALARSFLIKPIESERYLRVCARYLDLNPVRAGIVARPEEYPWSSYGSRIGLGAVNGWTGILGSSQLPMTRNDAGGIASLLSKKFPRSS